MEGKGRCQKSPVLLTLSATCPTRLSLERLGARSALCFRTAKTRSAAVERECKVSHLVLLPLGDVVRGAAVLLPVRVALVVVRIAELRVLRLRDLDVAAVVGARSDGEEPHEQRDGALVGDEHVPAAATVLVAAEARLHVRDDCDSGALGKSRSLPCMKGTGSCAQRTKLAHTFCEISARSRRCLIDVMATMFGR